MTLYWVSQYMCRKLSKLIIDLKKYSMNKLPIVCRQDVPELFMDCSNLGVCFVVGSACFVVKQRLSQFRLSARFFALVSLTWCQKDGMNTQKDV